MSSDTVNNGRRRFLTATTAVVGAGGVAALAVPYVKTFKPSARAEAAGAPVEVNIADLQPGQRIEAEWRGKPVFVVRRTDEALSKLGDIDDRLRDADSNESDQPEYAKNATRSVREDIFVMVAICTHLGCVPLYVPEIEPQPFDENWIGGFYCPCHQSRFDLAGRVFQGVPAPANMAVPPYRFSADGNLLTIGLDPEGAA
jgi:ubiquinol-cytochrome c reductase iron-sulfur subunit